MVDSPRAAAWRGPVPSQMTQLLRKNPHSCCFFFALPMTQKKMHLDTGGPKQHFGKYLLQINQNRKMHPLRKREVSVIFSTDYSAALFYTVYITSSQCYSTPLPDVSTFLSAVGSISPGPWLWLGKPWHSVTWQHFHRTSWPSTGEAPAWRRHRQDPTLEWKLVRGLCNKLDVWALQEWLVS